MSDYSDETDNQDQAAANAKKKKGGDTTAAGRGRDKPVISEAAQSLMRERGFSMQQITALLKNWKHLDAKEVAVRLAEFGTGVAKASAHILVEITRDARHAILFQFDRHTKRLAQLTRKLAPEKRSQLQKKHDVNLG